MAGQMIYNYDAVDTHSLTFENICNRILSNNGDLKAMDTQLRSAFDGDGAEAWRTQITTLMSKLDQYTEALTRLRTVVQNVAGRGGGMQVTDKEQGGRFLSINI